MNSIFQNRLYDWLTTACRLIVLGFLFLFTSIPLVTFGASFTALYHCISREHTKTSAHICREYFSAFKSNFLQCLVPTILFLFYGAAMAVDLSQVFTGKATNLLPPFLWYDNLPRSLGPRQLYLCRDIASARFISCRPSALRTTDNRPHQRNFHPIIYNGRRLRHRFPGSRTFRPFSRNPLRHRQPSD